MLGLGNSITSLYTPGETAYIATTSFDLDGSDDYINLGNSWALKQRVTDTSEGVGLSAATWFKLDDIQTTGTTHILMHCVQYPGGWSFYYSNTRIYAVCNIGGASRSANLSVNTGWRTLGTDANPLRASGWHHVGITFDGRYLKIYINGSQYGTVADAGSDDNYIHHDSGSPGTDGATQPTCSDFSDTDLLIGADPGALSNDGSGCGLSGSASGSDNLAGLINEAAVWNKVLSEDCFSEIYEAVNTNGAVLDLTKNSGNYTNSGDLVALYRGDSIDGTTATNVANPGTHDGSMKNSVGTSSTVPS